jgi:hypothetical protein
MKQDKDFNSRTDRKAARQHQTDKGGLNIIGSSPWVRISSFIPTKNRRVTQA